MAEKVTVTERITYDASRTPELGDEGHDEQALAAVDLGPLVQALRECLPVEAELPAAARSRSKSATPAPAAPESNGHTEALTAVLQHELAEARAEIARQEGVLGKLSQRNRELEAAALGAYARLRDVVPAHVDTRGTVELTFTNTAPRAPVPAASPPVTSLPPLVEHALLSTRGVGTVAPAAAEGAESSGSTEAYRQALLATICSYGPLNRERLSLLSGKSRTSTTFAAALRWLVGARLITDEQGQMKATMEGQRQSRQDPLPIGRKLYEHWRQKLSPYDAQSYDAIAKVPGGLTRRELAERTGHSQTSTTFAASIRRLKGMGLAGEANGRVFFFDHVRTSMGLS